MLTMIASKMNLGSYLLTSQLKAIKWARRNLNTLCSFQLKASLDMLVLGSCTIPNTSLSTFNILLDLLQVLIVLPFFAITK